MTKPNSTKSCRKLRSSFMPSQNIFSALRTDLALLFPQHENAQQRQYRHEHSQSHKVGPEISNSEPFGEGADADRNEVSHREGPPHDLCSGAKGGHRRHHASELG